MASVTYEPGFSGPLTIAHGDIVTVTGAGFGSKTAAAPVLWDDGSGPSDIREGTEANSRWEDGWPKATNNAEFAIQRRASDWRGVATPHSRTGRYITGCHGEGTATTGYNVVAWKNFAATPNTVPLNLYVSYWQQIDPAWSFGGDNNFKSFVYGPNNPPTANATRVWGSYGDHFPSSLTDFAKWQMGGEDATFPWFAHGFGLPQGINPFGRWVKYEIVCRMTSGSDGFARIYENGAQVLGFNGVTDINTATMRRFGIGAYARRYNNSNNFRYFTDCYIDTSHARVMLVSGENFSSASSLREMQIPTAWSSASIQFRANFGAFGATGTAQLYAVTSANTPIKVATVALDDAPPPGDPPVITSHLAAAGVEDASFSYSITATETPTTFAATSLPTGLGVNVTTGVVSGIPTVTGDSLVPISAANANGSDEDTLALVVRPAIPSVGTGAKPTAVGETPEVGHPLTADLLVSWLFNEGNVPSPAATLVNGGSGAATYNVTMDYTATGNYLWVADGPSYALRSVVSANGERPLFPATPITTGTTWTFECLYTPQGGNTDTWLLVTGQTIAGSQGVKIAMSAAGKPNFHYSGTQHSPTQPPFALSQPWHVVISVDAGVGRWYINGVQQFPTMNAVPSFVLDRLFTNTAASHSASFGGIVHHMRVWTGRALTAPEAESLYLDPYAMYGTASPTAPVISSSLTASGDEDQPFVYGIVASPLPDQYDAIGLPAGLQVDQELGIIFGTPTESGAFNVTISASNSIGTDEATLVLTITAAPTPPVITSDLHAGGRNGEAFSYSIVATNTPTSYAATGLPTGLSVNTGTGAITGTPTVDGTFSVTISATNADGTGSETLVVTIEPPFAAPVITSPLTASVTEGQPFVYTITATGEPLPTFSATGLPAGLTVQTTGEITGTPTTVGTFNVTISATNEAGTHAQILTLTVNAVAVLPVITSALTATGRVGQAFTYSITATGSPTSFDAHGELN